MRAIALEQFGGPDVLKLMDLPTPQPGPGEVRIRVAASGVNPVDWKIREGFLKGAFPYAFPLIPGWECSGFIDALGDGASRFRRGDAVYAYTRLPTVRYGTYAEFIVVPEGYVAAKPERMLLHQAAGVPLAGLTAWQSLFRGHDDVRAGATVLVHAASGGVGMFAAQLARAVGARVIATAGPANQDFLRGLGVHHAVDYQAGDFREAVRAVAPDGVDVVMDCVGKDTLARSYELVRPGGRLVGVVDTPDQAAAQQHGLRLAHYHFVQPSAHELAELGRLIDSGAVRAHVSAIYALEDAARAQIASREGRTRGKAVLAL